MLLLALAFAGTAGNVSSARAQDATDPSPCHVKSLETKLPEKYRLSAKDREIYVEMPDFYRGSNPKWFYEHADEVASELKCVTLVGRFATQTAYKPTVLLVLGEQAARYYVLSINRWTAATYTPGEDSLWYAWAASYEGLGRAGGRVEVVGEFGGFRSHNFFENPSSYRVRGLLIDNARLLRWSVGGSPMRTPKEWYKFLEANPDIDARGRAKVADYLECIRTKCWTPTIDFRRP